MTQFVRTDSATNDDKPKAKFVKFGLFDEDNYKAKELAKAKQNEALYKPYRMIEGDILVGVMTSTHGTKWGDIMYLREPTINGNKLESGLVKIGISSPDIKYKLERASKIKGDWVEIEYLGQQQSPNDSTKTLHKVNVR